ncbi:MAG: hypothetical protein WC488_03305 [Candidatus Micrarchaeia archaeon]
MGEINVTIDENARLWPEKYWKIELAVYSAIAFSLPFLFPSSQLVTGTIVNALLIISALHFKGRQVLPVVMLPSIAALLNGAVFGPFTLFLVYMLPFIWAGNFLLVHIIRELQSAARLGYFKTLVLASVSKSALLFSGAFVLAGLSLVPSALLFQMGPMQFATALMGGIAVLILRRFAHLLK